MNGTKGKENKSSLEIGNKITSASLSDSSIPVKNSPHSNYYLQDGIDMGTIMDTDIPIKEVSIYILKALHHLHTCSPLYPFTFTFTFSFIHS